VTYKTDVNKKFKERNPSETVSVIKNFFKNLGYEITDIQQKTDVGTYFCHVCLYCNGNSYLETNGKGMTNEFSLASGYAELYERYCNLAVFESNPFFSESYNEAMLKKQGYVYSPFEKRLSSEEVIEDPIYKSFFTSLFRTRDQMLEGIRLITNGCPLVGAPFKSIISGNISYQDPRMLLRVNRTGGFAAGNTLTEALNQSISELCEHRGENDFLMGRFKDYHRISDEYLKMFPKQYAVIQEIRNQGNDIYILDLGYNTGLPVTASILINKNRSNISINFGSFPVFEISFERVLTELYQGMISRKHDGKVMIPYDGSGVEAMEEAANNAAESPYVPESSYLDCVVEEAPSEAFIQGTESLSNEDILEYYKKLFSDRGINAYYFDTSKSPDVYAVRVFIDRFDQFDWKAEFFKNSSGITINKNLGICSAYIDFCNQFVRSKFKGVTVKQFESAMNGFKEINGAYGGLLLNCEYLNFVFMKIGIFAFSTTNLLNHNLNAIESDGGFSQFFGKRLSLMKLADSYKRRSDLLEKLFAAYGSDIDFKMLCDKEYVYSNIILKTFEEKYYEMEKFIETFPTTNYPSK